MDTSVRENVTLYVLPFASLPSAGLDGDIFFTSDTSQFYMGQGGGLPLVLIGPGSGSSVLSGTVDPVSGDGIDGDFYINYTSWKIFGPKASGAWPSGVAIVGANGTFAGRSTATRTTASIANNAYEESTVSMSKSFLLQKLVASAFCRVQLYATAAAMAADATRAIGISPAAGTPHGVLGDWVLNTSAYIAGFVASPPVYGANLENVPTANISLRVTNLSGSSAAITVTATYDPLET